MVQPSSEFLGAFGSVTYHYAAIENSLQTAIAGMLKVSVRQAAVVSAPYSDRDLKDVVRGLAGLSRLASQDRAYLLNMLDAFAAHSPLHDLISHARWDRGERPGSIRPSGSRQDKRDWTLEEVQHEAEGLRALERKLALFCIGRGWAAEAD